MCTSQGYTAAVECALTFEGILHVQVPVIMCYLTARWLPIAIFQVQCQARSSLARLLLAREL